MADISWGDKINSQDTSTTAIDITSNSLCKINSYSLISNMLTFEKTKNRENLKIKSTRDREHNNGLGNNSLEPTTGGGDETQDKTANGNFFLLMTPFLDLFRCCLIAPNRIRYDKTSGEFVVEKARPFMNIASRLWLFCLSIYVIFFMFNELGDGVYDVEVITGKLSWACYTIFDFTVVACLRGNVGQIAKLLTDGNQISKLLHQLQLPLKQVALVDQTKSLRSFVNIRRKHLNWLAAGLTLAYTMLFVLFVTTEFTAATTGLYKEFLNRTSHNGGSGKVVSDYVDLYYPCTSETQVVCNLIVRFATCFHASVLLVIWFLVAFTLELLWIAFLSMIIMFGFYMKRMIVDCNKVIEKGQVDLIQGLRIYTKISLLLEEFNNIFGNTVLWIVIASLLWFPSATLGELVGGFSNGLVYGTVNIAACIPFLVTLYIASELHKVGDLLPSLIKKRFANMDIIREKEQTLQLGAAIVQFDTLSSNIGLKGAGFFTISYTLVGSMVGIIITYSLVTVQFTLK